MKEANQLFWILWARALRHTALLLCSILNETQVTLIKGNAAEIAALCGSNDAKAQGVDSVGELRSAPALVRRLARQEGAFVLLTGEVDYLTDGECVIESRCGSEMLGCVTLSLIHI